MAVATYQEVAVALGRPISTEQEQAQINWWLTGVEMLIRGRLGDITLLDQDALRYVEVEAVAEKVRHHGTRESSISVAVDDATVTRRYENQIGAADMTTAWWELLSPTTTTDSFTIKPIRHRRPSCWGEYR